MSFSSISFNICENPTVLRTPYFEQCFDNTLIIKSAKQVHFGGDQIEMLWSHAAILDDESDRAVGRVKHLLGER